MKPDRFVQARRPRAARDVPKGKSARSGVVSVDENISATKTARNIYLTTEADFATNFIATCALFMSTDGRFRIQVKAMNEDKWRAAA
jgi:hypothetical protein